MSTATLTPAQREVIEARDQIAAYLAEVATTPNMSVERRHAISEYAKRHGHNFGELASTMQRAQADKLFIAGDGRAIRKALNDAERFHKSELADIAREREALAKRLREAEAKLTTAKVDAQKLLDAEARLSVVGGTELDRIPEDQRGLCSAFHNKIVRQAFAQIAK